MIEKHITSFIDGRVRLRHKALRMPDVAEQVRLMLPAVPGVRGVAVNQRTGSLLLEYAPEELTRDTLLEMLRQWEGMACLAARDTDTPRPIVPARLRRAAVLRTVNRGMLATLAASLALAASGRAQGHALAGGLFLAFNACHLWAVRKAL